MPASAAVSSEWQACEGIELQHSPDRQIAACTAIIESGRENKENLGIAYTDRGGAYEHKGQYDRAIADFDRAIALRPDGVAFNDRCFARAIANRDLGAALADCNRALELLANDTSVLDSRGFVYFRLGQFDKAIADYDAALRGDPESASSLYVRGLAKRHKGDTAGGDADIAAAKVIDPKVANTYAGYGVA